MEMGILGLPRSGKSTLFEIMTGENGRDGRGEACRRGQADVPDSRFDHLVDVFQPLKVTPARIPFIDVNFRGDHPGDSIRQTLNGTDGLIHVVDGFTTGDRREIAGRYRKLADDMVLSDLLIVENRMDRMARLPAKALKAQDQAHRQILPRLKEGLEKGMPLRAQRLTADEIFSLKSFSFLSIRPELVVVNRGESSPSGAGTFRDLADFPAPAIDISCRIEAELVGLTPPEQKEFLNDLGVEEPAFRRVIREAFSLLGRICYFTVGEDEVKAWVIPAGSLAPQAAAAIHRDFERGFIKAEVVGYEDFVACGNTLAGAKAAGKMRLEGKDYIVQDGDIISFRFNI
jgi:GTP-binding protein YchF